MLREGLNELHYITPIGNIGSIISEGILCHQKAQKVGHVSVAMQGVQDRRSEKTVPGGLPLHNYVNLYINARNPMLYRVLDPNSFFNTNRVQVCILRIDANVLDLPNVVVSDMNAAVNLAGFYAVDKGLLKIDKELVFAQSWDDPDYYVKQEHKQKMCAEVLVPNKIEPGNIRGAYVSCLEDKEVIESTGVGFPITVKPYMFFKER